MSQYRHALLSQMPVRCLLGDLEADSQNCNDELSIGYSLSPLKWHNKSQSGMFHHVWLRAGYYTADVWSKAVWPRCEHPMTLVATTRMSTSMSCEAVGTASTTCASNASATAPTNNLCRLCNRKQGVLDSWRSAGSSYSYSMTGLCTCHNKIDTCADA